VFTSSRHHGQFRDLPISRCWDVTIYSYHKMATVRRLAFLKRGNFNCRHSSPSCQISCWSVYPLTIWPFFSIFHDPGLRHLEFLKLQVFNECRIASPYQISWRSVKPLPRYRDFLIFQDGARRLWFNKFLIFNGRNGQEGQSALVLLCQISSKSLEPQPRYGDFFVFSIWRRSAILDLL